MSKEEVELRLFLKFASAAGLNVDPGTARSELPNRPDVWCKIDGIPRYFELTRVADPEIANDIGFKRTSRGAGSGPKVVSYSDVEVVREAVEAKVSKPYETGGDAFDLLLYCDGTFHPRVEIGLVRAVLQELEQAHRNKWSRIWLYDARVSCVLWPEGEHRGT